METHTWIRAARQTLGLSQTEFANLLGTKQTQVSRWETGKMVIPDEVLTTVRGQVGNKDLSGVEVAPPQTRTRRAKSKGRKRGGPSKAALIEKVRATLGTIPDKDAAELAGVSASTIVNYRKRLGIAAYRRGGRSDALPPEKSAPTTTKRRTSGSPAAAAAPLAAPTSANQGFAWRVVFVGDKEQVERYLVASSIVEVAARVEVESLKIGRVSEVSCLGSAL